MNIQSKIKFKINIFFLKKLTFHCICLQDLRLDKGGQSNTENVIFHFT